MKVSIVTTSINPPTFLDSYINNFKKYKVPVKDITFIVVGDKKTPHKLYRKEFDYNVEYWSPYKQKKWLSKVYPKRRGIKSIMPENSPRRRNFGYLRAIELGSDYTIVIDDDNLPSMEHDWFKWHLYSFKDKRFRVVSSANRIVNPMRLLRRYAFITYSRGYPISEIFSDTFLPSYTENNNRKVMLNLGLWLDKPDVDAYTNIIYPDLITTNLLFHGFALDRDNYIPINTQNTAFKKEISPIFWNLYQEKLYDIPSDRYDDIWTGLFVNRLINKLNHTITFGQPCSIHKRNVHDFNKDLMVEFTGICMNSKMWEYIMNLDIQSKDYVDGYLEIADNLEKVKLFEFSTVNKFIKTLAKKMRLWVNLVEKVS